MTRTPLFATRALTVATLPLLFGFTDCGGALFSETEAPSMEGDWAITYDDVVTVEIAIGGAVYTSELGVEGGVVDVEVDGEPVSFALDCASENITCPSEVWAPLVTLEHRDPRSRRYLPYRPDIRAKMRSRFPYRADYGHPTARGCRPRAARERKDHHPDRPHRG